MTALDPFRRLAMRAAPLVISGDFSLALKSSAHASFAELRKLYPDNHGMSASEVALVQSFETAVKLNFEPMETRDLLWAAIKLFGCARAASARVEGISEGASLRPAYWWLE